MAFLKAVENLAPLDAAPANRATPLPSQNAPSFRFILAALAAAAICRVLIKHLWFLGILDPFTKQMLTALVYVVAVSPALFFARYILAVPVMKRMVVIAIMCVVLERVLGLVEYSDLPDTLPFLGKESYLAFTTHSILESFTFLLLTVVGYMSLYALTISTRRAEDAASRLESEIIGRRRAESDLALSEERYRLLMEHAQGLAVIGFGLDGIVQYWNRAAEEMYGYSAAEAIGTPLNRLIIPENAQQQFDALIQRGRTATTSATLMPAHEMSLRNRNGQQIPAFVVHAVVCVDGHNPILFCLQLDLREQKRTEEALAASEDRFRSIVHNALDVFVIVSEDGTVRYAAPSVARVLGYREEVLTGKSVLEIVHPDERGHAIEQLKEGVRGGWANRITEYRVRHADGTWHHMEICGSNLLERNSVKGLVLNARDITDRKHLEEQYRQSQKMEALGALAGGVAHDFNNILTAILMNCELLKIAAPLEPTVQHGIEEIYKAGRRATGLTRQLLTFSRRTPSRLQIVEMNAIVRDMEKMLCRLIGEDVKLETVLPAEPISCYCDASQLEQIMLNLVVNARDAMPNGGTLTIALSKAEFDTSIEHATAELPAGAYVKLAVSDTGCGISPEDLQHIFEPFFTTKAEGRGTGLGLATVYGIVHQCHGNIEVESEVGVGTTFKVFLPLPRTDEIMQSPVMANPTQWPLTQATILIVEDESDILDLSARILREQGYAVLKAGSPGEALRVCKQYDGKIDLVLTDVIMPDLSGPEMIKRIEAMRPGTNVLYMSGYTADRMETSGVAIDHTRLLEKPFTLDQLVSNVEQAVRKPISAASRGQWVVFE